MVTLDFEKQPRSSKTVIARPSELAIPALTNANYAVSTSMVHLRPALDIGQLTECFGDLGRFESKLKLELSATSSLFRHDIDLYGSSPLNCGVA